MISKKKKIYLYGIISILTIIVILITIYLYPPKDIKINSIAVLPLENISNDPTQDYFVDGITDVLISELAQISALKVISRTSAMKYKGSEKTIPEIGRELNVAHVLEGSVRKFGERLRVTAQLINTQDGFHVWAEDFKHDYRDLFDIQDEVSEMIATRLLRRLSSQELEKIKTLGLITKLVQDKIDEDTYWDLKRNIIGNDDRQDTK